VCDVVSVRLRQEVVDGLRVMFDFTLPLILLYNSEHAQYQQLTKPEPIKLSVFLSVYFIVNYTDSNCGGGVLLASMTSKTFMEVSY